MMVSDEWPSMLCDGLVCLLGNNLNVHTKLEKPNHQEI
jgi:hypothetical protein